MGVVGRLGDPDEMMRRANQPPAPAAQGSQGCPRIRLALLWPPPQSCPPHCVPYSQARLAALAFCGVVAAAAGEGGGRAQA